MPVKRSTRVSQYGQKRVRESKRVVAHWPVTGADQQGNAGCGDPGLVDVTQGHHRSYFFLDGFVCDSADPAMDFVRPLDLPSRNAADALRATALDVCFVFLAIPLTSSTDSGANPHIRVSAHQNNAW